MKFEISHLIRKIANIGTTVALINSGTEPQVATRYGQIAEGIISGISLKDNKEDIMQKLNNAFIECTFHVLKYEAEIEIDLTIAEKISNDLFGIESLNQYISSIDETQLLIKKFKDCCLEHNLPIIEQEIDINRIIEKIIFNINNIVVNDIHFLLINLLLNSLENRKDISELKEVLLDNKDNRDKFEFKCDQKGEFIKKWYSNLFLHNNIKNNKIRLCDIYTETNFKCKQYQSDKKISKLIIKFLGDEKKQSMIILGNPGLGKSSLMCYMANLFREINNYIFIKMYDLDPNISKISLLDAILDYMECKRKYLKNMVIFLDGYDELRVDSKHYELCIDLLTDLKQIKAKVIISTRLNYIDLNKNDFNRDFLNTVIVELLPFNKQQMFYYFDKYEKLSNESIDKVKTSFNNKKTEIEVYGIPFILYLICSLNININEMTDIQSIYDKVFAFNGGLYDKIYDNESGHYLTQNPQCKKDLLNISMEIAYMMFKDNQIFIESKIFNNKIISKYQDRAKTFALGNYYCIENDKLYFVHKTLQEYFTGRFIILVLENNVQNYMDGVYDLRKTIDNIFGLLYCDNYLFKRIEHILSNLIIDSNLLSTKFRNAFEELIPYLYNMYIENIYTDKISKNNFSKSQNYLSSIHKIVNMLGIDTFCGVNDIDITIILRSKQYVNMIINNLKMVKIDLSGVYLRGVLNNCHFNNVNFCRVDLSSSLLNEVNLSNCMMNSIYAEKACFNNVVICKMELKNSNLYKIVINNSTFDNLVIENVDFTLARFNECTFINVRFVHCNFKHANFVNIKGKVVLDRCRIENKFILHTDECILIDCYSYNELDNFDTEREEINAKKGIS